ncbi:MAG: hypothetical protein IKI24_00970 [Clostridia bacterium]|nr:hypothetical protein [Clostridia bacterium]
MLKKPRHLFDQALHILLLGILSAAFMTLFSYSTSPLYPHYIGNDSSFFRMVGQAMTRGMLPYRDIFDMKGPYLFVIEYVAQLISFGRSGIFLVQILNLWLALILADRLSCLFGAEGKGARLLMAVSVLSVAATALPAGNYTEEFSLAPLFSCIYVCAKFLRSGENGKWTNGRLCLAGGWFGLMLGFLAYVRVTNASLIGGLMIAVVITLLVEKRAFGILPCAAGFMLGLVFALLPPAAYFWAKGLLREFYEAVFVLGYKYATEQSLLGHLYQTLSYNGLRSALLLILAAACALPVLFGWSSRKNRLMLVLSGLFTFFAISAGNNYRHYYILMIPPVTLGIIALIKQFGTSSRVKKAIAAVVLAAMILFAPAYLFRSGNDPVTFMHMYSRPSSNEALSQDAVAHIPEDEKDSIFTYNIGVSFWLYADVYPSVKYCCWQNHYIELMPGVENELTEIFASSPPKWVLLRPDPGELPAFLTEALAESYTQTYSNEIFVLHRLNSL